MDKSFLLQALEEKLDCSHYAIKNSNVTAGINDIDLVINTATEYAINISWIILCWIIGFHLIFNLNTREVNR